MEVSFYLKRAASPTPTAIFARICYEGYKIKYYTPEKVLPKLWNTSKQRVKESTKFTEYPEFNRRLDNIESGIKTVIRKYINDNENNYPTPSALKPLLDIAIRNGGKVDKITFMSYYADYIERCKNGRLNHAKTGKPLTTGTIRSYQTTLFNIERYIADTRKIVDFDTIDLDFYASFGEYLANYTNEDTGKQKQSLNTIGKHIKVIKSILNEATEQGINKNLAFKSRKFLAISEDADTVYLADWELQQLAELDLTDNTRLEVIRDLFLIGCSTGLRFSDLSTLTPKQINGNMITLTQIKTGKPVIIPVHELVNEILNKYEGKLPEARSNQKTNEYLKEVCKLTKGLNSMVSVSSTKGGEMVTETIAKWQLVTTHTARRSFATNEYLAGTPSLTIMAITGHKTEKSFLKYIKVTPDQHAKILQGIWADRKVKEVKRIAI